MMSIEYNYHGLNISKQEVKGHQNEGQKAFLNYWTVIVKGKNTLRTGNLILLMFFIISQLKSENESINQV